VKYDIPIYNLAMPLKHFLFLTFVIGGFVSGQLIAQSHDWRVVASGDTLSEATLLAVKDDSLLIERKLKQSLVAVKDLFYIERKQSAYNWGAMVGGLAGIAVGVANTQWEGSDSQNSLAQFFSAIVSPIVFAFKVAVYGVGGAAVGAIMGAPVMTTEKHDFTKMSADEIKSVLREIIE